MHVNYTQLLQDMGLQDDQDAINVANMVHYLNPNPVNPSDPLRRLYGLLCMADKFQDHNLNIMKKWFPDDPNFNPHFQKASHKFTSYLNKLLKNNNYGRLND